MTRLTRRIEAALRAKEPTAEALASDDLAPAPGNNRSRHPADTRRSGGTNRAIASGTLGTRRAGRPERPVARRIPSWEELSAAVGQGLVDDLQRALASFPGAKPLDASRATRRFFLTLAERRHSSDRSLLKSLQASSSGQTIDIGPVLAALIAAFEEWMAGAVHSGALRATTMEGYAAALAHTLERLGTLPDRSYPKFTRREVRIPGGEGEARSLGSLDWPEFEGRSTTVRERLGLDTVRGLAFEAFARYEALFRFGQETLTRDDPPEGVDADAWRMVKRLLEEEHASWLGRGHSLFHPSAPKTARRLEIMPTLASRDVWLRAGVPSELSSQLFPQRKNQGRYRFLGWLCSACLGPTRLATIAMQTILCCDTGWNKQPIVDLHREPFLLRTDNEVGIATSAFVYSFKS